MKPDIYDKIIQWVENIGSIAAEELPIFVKESAEYGFYSNLVKSAFALFMGMILVILSIMWYRKSRTYDYDTRSNFIIGSTLFGIIAFIMIMISCVFISEAIKANVAPRLYVLERFINK